MKNANFKKILSLTLIIVLIAAIALFAGCKGGEDTPTTTAPSTEASTDAQRTVLGEGSKSFIFAVTDAESKTTEYEIHTDKETVGAALLELKLIEGEDGQYGLYVQKVDGIATEGQTYWALYVDGEYGLTGVDQTEIKEGSTYEFKIEAY